MNMKISASLKPESKERVSTMGSVRNILNGRTQILMTSLKFNRSRRGVSSPGPHTFSPFALRFFAIRSIMMVLLVSGTRMRWRIWTATPKMS